MTSRKGLLTAAGFLAFFAFGFVDNLKGPLLPELLRSSELTYSQGGNILLAGNIGFIVATLLSGMLADVSGNRGVLCLAGVALIAGSLGMGTAASPLALMCWMAVIGLGLGGIELGANGLMIELHSLNRGRYLNLLATCHGLGSLFVPLYAASLLVRQIHWQTIYASVTILALPITVIFAVASLRASKSQRDRESPIGDRDIAEPKPKQTSWDWNYLRAHAFTLRMWAYYFLLAAYVASELGLAGWLVEFLQQKHGYSEAASSYSLSGFFCLLMLGRFLGAFVVERFGYLRSIALALVGSTLCLAGGIWGSYLYVGAGWLWLLPLSGLFMSIVFPTVAAQASSMHASNVGSVLGILFAAAGVGGAIGLGSIGWVSETLGLTRGLSCTVGFSLFALAMLGIIQRYRFSK